MMLFRKKHSYSERRIVYASVELVWNLLANYKYLSRWIPLVTRLEHLGMKDIKIGSVLWVETLVGNKEKLFLCTISDYQIGRFISFQAENDGVKICYNFQVEKKENGLTGIFMTSEVQLGCYWSVLLKRKKVQKAISYGWKMLDALDMAITTFKSTNE